MHPRRVSRTLDLFALGNCLKQFLSRGVLGKLPNLTAAVLDGQSHELGRLLKTRGIPFVVYTACDLKEGKFARAPTVEKPAPVTDVVARVEELLTGGGQASS